MLNPALQQQVKVGPWWNGSWVKSTVGLLYDVRSLGTLF